MTILILKKDVKKPLTEEQRQRLGSNDSGVSWVKNVKDTDKEKYLATILPKAKRVEIQKSRGGVDLKIIIGIFDNHPKIKSYPYRYGFTSPVNMIISIGQNGTPVWTLEQLEEMLEAIKEGIDIVTKL